jgi:hypothetical protein
MRVTRIRSDISPTGADCLRLSADVSYDDASTNTETLWFDVPAAIAVRSVSGNPWLAATLPLASKLGEPLHIDGPVDVELLAGARELMEWWRYWFPAMSVVRVDGAAAAPPAGVAGSRTAQFFSGGVDSFFTLLRHADPADPLQVDDLLAGWGFDIPLSDAAAFDRLRTSLAATSTRLGKRLVPFATNIRETRFGRLPWGTIGHGSAMAAVALLFEDVYRRVLIPSTDGYRETGPWGSHATVDHFHSSSKLRVIHDGAAFSRLQKVALVAQSAAALSALRVCWRSKSDSNCGACEKCLRTMIALQLCDALDAAATFAHVKLDLRNVRRVHCPYTRQGSMQLYYLEMRDAARERRRFDLAQAIAVALRCSSRREPLLWITQRATRVPVLGRLAQGLDRALRRSFIT